MQVRASGFVYWYAFLLLSMRTYFLAQLVHVNISNLNSLTSNLKPNTVHSAT